jgi:Fur family ferric uptake transcriptional regulator
MATVREDEIRRTLQQAGLRVTGIRVRVYRLLAASQKPLSHREAVDALPWLDRVSVFRNLVSLVEGGLARRLELGDHTWRFEMTRRGDLASRHAHFSCTHCGDVACLDDLRVEAGEDATTRFGASLMDADVLLRGVCPSCA